MTEPGSFGLDDFSKYGRLAKSYDGHPCYRFVEGDAKDTALMRELASDVDQVVASAAMIGGISYFHEFAYDLIAENERILASTFDAAINEMIDALREYAEDWQDHLLDAPNHRDNWGLVQMICLSTDDQLREWLVGGAP